MDPRSTSPVPVWRLRAGWLAACAAAVLAACGGGGPDPAAAEPAATPAALATGTTTLLQSSGALPDSAAAQLATPSFHAAPVLLDEPDLIDADGSSSSARRGPHQQAVPAAQAGLPTRGLTVQRLEDARRAQALAAAVGAEGQAQPLAGANTVSAYTPAQIRAAYGLPPLPSAGSSLSAAQAAALGAGQTVYIVDAMHDPNVAAELAAFNQRFGLPLCTRRAIAPTATLPLPAPSAASCDLSVVYVNTRGAMTATAPAFDAGWATEIALDVQWAHATAPLARIVLIEAPSASVDSLLGAVRLANAMGPGVVSMSFGSSEGSWTASSDAAFAGPGMSYLAATGDSGAAVSWPSASARVLAVGGTTLSWGGSGTRAETAWSGTGGGTSAYVARPAYQTPAVPGLGTQARRTVADVAFNANPASGQYTAVMGKSGGTVNWLGVGGTSLATPQWAGLVAVANALRAQAGQPVVTEPHALLYGQIGAVPGRYAEAFLDVVQGSHGSCAGCSARAGYDAPTGLGTPNGSVLLTALSGASLPPVPPVVVAASFSGQVGRPLSFTVGVTAAHALSLSVAGAPAGLVLGNDGVATWASPVAGTYALAVTATDTDTGLVGQGTVTVVITAPEAPKVTGATVPGVPGKALAYAVQVAAPNPVSWALREAPRGMAISAAGVLSWAAPVAGSYNVSVTATDTRTGLSGTGVLVVAIGKVGPTISAEPMKGKAGQALTGTITLTAPASSWLSVSVRGAPLGMSFSLSGLKLTARWPKPVTGSYSLEVQVTDSAGNSASATVPVVIKAK